jgi:long-subunit fatty acid transport protein
MNTNSRTKKNLALYLLAAVFAFAPLCNAGAQSNENEFGVWTTLEASKKINKKLKLDFEAELRTIEGVGDIERLSLGAGASYKFTKWLKASAGYIFIYSHSLDEKKLKTDDPLIIDGIGTFYDYNIDHAYWTERHRFHLSITGEYKVGRVEFSLRERLQYTRTNSAVTDESKYRWHQQFDENYNEIEPALNLKETVPELKESKHNTTLRSRLTAKWDIAKCKVNPFASVELYTRLDDWKGCDKMRYRIGASYKINKDNSVSLFYMYQDANDDDEPKGHAIGLGYSIDL